MQGEQGKKEGSVTHRGITFECCNQSTKSCHSKERVLSGNGQAAALVETLIVFTVTSPLTYT